VPSEPSVTEGDLIQVDGSDARRVVLLEDHGLIAHTLAAALDGRGIDVHVVDPAQHDDLPAALTEDDPELVLLDLDLGPRGDSVGLIGPLSEAGTPVVIVSGVQDPVRLARCVSEGAVGVLGKSGSFEELVTAIERALEKGTLLTPHEREQHLDVLREHDAAERERLGPFDRLTQREAQVLGALMRGRSVDQIAHDEYVSVATVRTHIRGVLTKLGVTSQLAATARATQAGWTPPEAD
jgi:DNA-binding NarL/FixJ family response regulator